MNHINNYKYKAIFRLSAFNLIQNALPNDFFTLLDFEEIPAEKIILKPPLIKLFFMILTTNHTFLAYSETFLHIFYCSSAILNVFHLLAPFPFQVQ